MTVSGNESSVLIGGLSPFTNYSLFVQAETVALGDRSDVLVVSTDEDG